ncbi:MAG: guanylate kinase [Acidobacteriota bacterium]
MNKPAGQETIAFVLSAPSGAGKTTLAVELLRRLDGLHRTISCTTRAPRPGEQDGRDYTFLSRQEFERLQAAGEFLESATVHGNLYGTPRSELERIRAMGRDALMVIDVQGAAEVRGGLAEAVTIFVLPPSRVSLQKRLNHRDGNAASSRATIGERLEVAAEEIAQFMRYDYLVINDDLDVAVGELQAIVVAERCRRVRRAGLGESILESFR